MDYSKDQHWPNRRVNDSQGCVEESDINHLKKYLRFFFPPTKLHQTCLVKRKCFKATVFFKFYILFVFFWLLIQSYKSRHAVRGSECEMEHSGNISRVGTVCERVCEYVCVCIFMHSGTRQVCFCGQNNPCYCPAILLLLPHARPIRQKGTTTNNSKSWHQIYDNKV